MLWINFIHFYQPANADKEKINEAITKSYERIIRGLEEQPNTKFTANITGCLLLRLDEDLKRHDIIIGLKKLIEKRQLEIVGSAAYHPILPLINETQARDQILENERILRKYFGEDLNLKGFFFPEMAYSATIAKIVKSLNYEWIILDEISANGKLNNLDTSKIYSDTNSDLSVIFRSRTLSQTFIPETILNQNSESNSTLISATDAELYGLRHIDEPANFEKVLKSINNVSTKTQTISNYINSQPTRTSVNLVSSTWESTEEELKQNTPYFLWQNCGNGIQEKLWELASYAQILHYKYNNDENIWWSRWHLVRGLASCTFWWASRKNMNHVFGPIAWNPDQIELGTQELIRSIRDIEKSTNLEEKLKAENLFNELIKKIWEKHWKKYA